MALNIDIPQPKTLKPKITIFGVGGAGGNAVNNMIRSKLEGVDFVAANTDAQALEHSLAAVKIQLGEATTKGLGAGSFPDRGRAAAEENIEEIEKCLEGNHMVFIAAGMGGGTGTGAAPVIAKLAREREILTVGVITKPFHFEGKYRMEIAQKGIDELKKYVDTLIVIPNQNLFRIANERTTFESAFKMADDVLHAGVRGITDLITMPGLVNLDFADIRTIMTKMGKAMMGTGEAEGDNRAIEACEAAISNPLLDDISIKGAKGVLVNMTGGPDMTLFEADLAVNAIKREVDSNANIIFGSAFNEDMKGKIRISVVATGIDEDEYRENLVKNSLSDSGSKFKNDITSHVIKAKDEISKIVNKTFFDPGVAETVGSEEIEEINENDFKSNRSFSKEENVNYGKADSPLTNKNIDSDLTNDDFFEPVNSKKNENKENLVGDVDGLSLINNFKQDKRDEVEENENLILNTKKVSVKKDLNKDKNPIQSHKKSKANHDKESSSGFSLFSFMNSGKKNNEEEDKINSFDNDEEFLSEKKHNKSFNENKKFGKESCDENNESKESVNRKKQDFFGSTIFDEKQDNTESGLEDDILNVPAFFRRRK